VEETIRNDFFVFTKFVGASPNNKPLGASYDTPGLQYGQQHGQQNNHQHQDNAALHLLNNNNKIRSDVKKAERILLFVYDVTAATGMVCLSS
jgi:hypothetical protein